MRCCCCNSCLCALWAGCDSCIPFTPSPLSTSLFLFPNVSLLPFTWPAPCPVTSLLKTSSSGVMAVALVLVVVVVVAPLSPIGLDLLLLPACNGRLLQLSFCLWTSHLIFVLLYTFTVSFHLSESKSDYPCQMGYSSKDIGNRSYLCVNNDGSLEASGGVVWGY